MSAVILRAAQKKSPTRPRVSRRLTLPKEKTSPTATVLPLKPGHRTTTAGDMEPEAGSPLQFILNNVSKSFVCSMIGKAHTYIHTVDDITLYTDSECAQNRALDGG